MQEQGKPQSCFQTSPVLDEPGSSRELCPRMFLAGWGVVGSRAAAEGAWGPSRARDFKRWGLRGVLAASAAASSTVGPSASPHPLAPHRNGEGSLVLPSQARAVTWARGGLGAGRKEGGESGLTSDNENPQVQLGNSCCNSIALCYLSIKPNTFCLAEDDHSGLKTTGYDLKALGDCASAASLGNLFQWLIILPTKNCAGFLIWIYLTSAFSYSSFLYLFLSLGHLTL